MRPNNTADLLSNDVPIGSLRTQVEVWGPSVGQDGQPLRDPMNAIITVLVLVAGSIPARITAQAGQARYATEQYLGRRSHIITIRYRTDVAKSMQVRFAGRKFDIKYALDPMERHRWLHLLCMEEGL